MKELLFCLVVIFCTSCQQKEVPFKSQSVSAINSIDKKQFIGKDYLIDAQHSYVGFRIKYFGFSPVRGRFDSFSGTLFYDPFDITSLSTTVVVDVNSINTGNETRDEDLKKGGTWFDVASFPQMIFSSKEVSPNKDGGFDLNGDLTLKGITKQVVIKFEKPTNISKDWAENDQIDFSGRFTINRQDFEVFGGDFWSSVMENGLTQLSDEVEIEMDIHCRRADYIARYDGADSSDVRKEILDIIKNEGIDRGLEKIEGLYASDELSSGKLSTIHYTLNAWQMHDEAVRVVNKRIEYYPEKISSWNQLGITKLFLNQNSEGLSHFHTVLKSDSLNDRALEYIRLVGKMESMNIQ